MESAFEPLGSNPGKVTANPQSKPYDSAGHYDQDQGGRAMTEHIVKTLTNWTGSQKTEELVREQVRQLLGEDEADSFDPRYSARPLRAWHKLGMRVKDSEFNRPLRSFVLIQKKDKDGVVTKRYFKTIFLYHVRQTELVKR